MKGTKPGRKTRRNQHGIITVFVTLIMVPVVVITGMLVDVARIKFYSSQALMTADSYGEAVLSQYDNLLKQLYGLFAVTQNEKGLEAVKNLSDYAKYSFQPNMDDKGLSGFMPYKDADVQLTYEKVDGASLSQSNVLMTQINDFMKYRIVQEVLEAGGILSSLQRFDNTSEDMDVMKARNDITKESADILEKIGEYYQDLKKLAAYPAFLSGCEVFFAGYSSTLKSIVNPGDGEDQTRLDAYEKYYNYINSDEKDAIDQAYAYFEGDGGTVEGEEGTEEEDGEGETELSEEESERLVDLYDQYVDTEEYLKGLKRTIEVSEDLLKTHLNEDDAEINFENADDIIDSLGKKAGELQSGLGQLKNQIQILQDKLPGCSEEVKDGIEAEIKDLQEIIDQSGNFQGVYELIRNGNHNGTIENNQSNLNTVNEKTAELDAAKASILEGSAEPGKSDWARKILLSWVDFREDGNANRFFEWLKELCETGDGGKGDKDAGEKEIDKANGAEDDALEELDKDEEPREGTRDISPELAEQLKSAGGTSGTVPGLKDYFSGGMSFQGLADAGTGLISKFMLATYDFGMFSSRVTGIAPEDHDADDESGSEDYTDYSLTGMEMSKDINYLYGAELEYLFGGHNSSKDNLNNTRNIICGVRLTMNFISSYQITEVNSAISTVANAAAGFGGPAAPLVRVAVSGALRAAFAAIETVADWNSLMNREGVIFLKKKLGDLQSLDKIQSLLGDIEENSSSSDGELKLTYENYMYILLVLLVDSETLTSRTSDLITLNVNQAQNKEELLKTLDFKMSDTVTAVKSTCKVKMDFVVVPDRFAELFLKGSDAEQTMKVMEDHYFGYSIIRGY